MCIDCDFKPYSKAFHTFRAWLERLSSDRRSADFADGHYEVLLVARGGRWTFVEDDFTPASDESDEWFPVDEDESPGRNDPLIHYPPLYDDMCHWKAVLVWVTPEMAKGRFVWVWGDGDDEETPPSKPVLEGAKCPVWDTTFGLWSLDVIDALASDAVP